MCDGACIIRVLSLCIVVAILWMFHESYFMVLMMCSALNAVAMYLQFTISQAELKSEANDILDDNADA